VQPERWAPALGIGPAPQVSLYAGRARPGKPKHLCRRGDDGQLRAVCPNGPLDPLDQVDVDDGDRWCGDCHRYLAYLRAEAS
jgi:hypothetical protein